jgi:hypothetical protein
MSLQPQVRLIYGKRRHVSASADSISVLLTPFHRPVSGLSDWPQALDIRYQE